jgi:hypothetical protein
MPDFTVQVNQFNKYAAQNLITVAFVSSVILHCACQIFSFVIFIRRFCCIVHARLFVMYSRGDEKKIQVGCMGNEFICVLCCLHSFVVYILIRLFLKFSSVL